MLDKNEDLVIVAVPSRRGASHDGDLVASMATAAPDDTSLMDWFIANAQPHFLAITTKSEALFKENDATFLLPDINFTQLWKCKLTAATKAAIWKYLHVMLLLVSHYQLNTHDFESTFAQWNEMLDGTT